MSTVFEILAKLTPWDVDRPKVRIGRQRDGGYVLLEPLLPHQAMLSFGIGRDVSFELAMAERGHRVFLFDHTVAAPPASHDRFVFFREGISASAEGEGPLLPLARHMDRPGLSGADLILKMDVEGHEWDALACADAGLLERFQQITLEVHRLKHLSLPGFRKKAGSVLDKLNEQFTLFHVHANNACGVSLADGFVVPELLELSYVKTASVARRPSSTCYPTEIDFPNVLAARDINLWFFPFLPASVDSGRLSLSLAATEEKYRANAARSR